MPLSVLTTITTPHLSDVAKPQLAQVPHASALLKDAKCPLDSGRWVEDPTWHLTATLSLPDGPAVYGEKVRLHLQLLNNFLNVFKDLFTFKCLAALPACMCVFLDTRRQQILELKLHMIATAHIFSSERPTKCCYGKHWYKNMSLINPSIPNQFSHINPLQENSGWQLSKC